jgi:hypothetical protein
MSPALGQDVGSRLDLVLFRAGSGLVHCLTQTGEMNEAKHHIEPVLHELNIRRYIPQVEVAAAKKMKKIIEKHVAKYPTRN